MKEKSDTLAYFLGLAMFCAAIAGAFGVFFEQPTYTAIAVSSILFLTMSIAVTLHDTQRGQIRQMLKIREELQKLKAQIANTQNMRGRS